ncbi:methyltransferase domain-containing protein [Nocardiopsis sp. CNT312]|uniref:methyltransferase domain-containing protein n=1 Tax=Nocardiopsis sp. CNT312 TaxID=1137268 RepID=UPI00048C2949|nr:methyltransferase domain-containing protein [Nocardiopsis sp. CNT312]
MTDLGGRHADLVSRLDTTDAIRAAFADHPRHLFIPDLVWPTPQGLPLVRTADPERWAAYVYDGDSVVTQANDGGNGLVNTPSSSSSAPQLMADMIEAARIGPGMRVLEIGTGTGWNARVLDSLVGPTGSVTSLEIDADVAAHARKRLSGSRVEVVHGTEAPGTGSYDAIIATCSVSRVPAAWIERAGEDAPIVVPWGPRSDSHASPVAVLRRTGPRSAAGPLTCEAFFMRDRTQRVPLGGFPGMGCDSASTRVVPFTPDDLVEDDLLTRVMLMLPGVRIGVGGRPFGGGQGRIVYMGTADSSWAYLWPDGAVHWGGPTPLADRLRGAYELLGEHGCPGLGAFTLEVDADGPVCRVRAPFGAWEHPV